jgi:cbb3-type cytochrome oxidase subunit 3
MIDNIMAFVREWWLIILFGVFGALNYIWYDAPLRREVAANE